MQARSFFRIMFYGLIALILISVVTAFAADLFIDPATVDMDSVSIDAEDLKPPACTMYLTTIRRGTGTITGTSGNDLILGSSGIDMIDGLEGDDCILGAEGDDIITGGNDNDHIIGGDGNDDITGSDGDDHIIGGSGTDVCTCGPGANSFDTCETVNDP